MSERTQTQSIDYHYPGGHHHRNLYNRSQSTHHGAESVNHEQAYRGSEVHHHKYERSSTKQVLSNHGFALTDGAKLGYGRYSKVCTALHIQSGRKIAVKIIDTRKVTHEYRKKFLPREIHNWRKLHHRNIVALMAVFDEGGKVFLAMELAHNGDLLSYVQQNGAQPEHIAQNWMCQLVSAVQYMHLRWIAHRDLKLENILLFDSNTVKIADFGFCRGIGSEGDLSLTFCGSKAYSAPEILLGRAYPPFKADVWSLGVIAFVIVTNRMPFDERVCSNTVIVNAQHERSYHYPRRLAISEACQQTIDAMMTFDFETRPNIHETISLPWFYVSAFFRSPMSSSQRTMNQNY
ncbi:Testis-specific serine/threonine-protein kinase 4 [Toxocara canis]|uniref:Testis-specific serine/threonine-protein kinase 4 n=1 Tax=Toxocara canis TaxID=6265 RepID=A0A0B2V3I0_TOXCA|nr:Testis-specific serine/threonine-protein kinase 4 [Toxocara canis]